MAAPEWEFPDCTDYQSLAHVEGGRTFIAATATRDLSGGRNAELSRIGEGFRESVADQQVQTAIRPVLVFGKEALVR